MGQRELETSLPGWPLFDGPDGDDEDDEYKVESDTEAEDTESEEAEEQEAPPQDEEALHLVDIGEDVLGTFEEKVLSDSECVESDVEDEDEEIRIMEGGAQRQQQRLPSDELDPSSEHTPSAPQQSRAPPSRQLEHSQILPGRLPFADPVGTSCPGTPQQQRQHSTCQVVVPAADLNGAAGLGLWNTFTADTSAAMTPPPMHRRSATGATMDPSGGSHGPGGSGVGTPLAPAHFGTLAASHQEQQVHMCDLHGLQQPYVLQQQQQHIPGIEDTVQPNMALQQPYPMPLSGEHYPVCPAGLGPGGSCMQPLAHHQHPQHQHHVVMGTPQPALGPPDDLALPGDGPGPAWPPSGGICRRTRAHVSLRDVDLSELEQQLPEHVDMEEIELAEDDEEYGKFLQALFDETSPLPEDSSDEDPDFAADLDLDFDDGSNGRPGEDWMQLLKSPEPTGDDSTVVTELPAADSPARRTRARSRRNPRRQQPQSTSSATPSGPVEMTPEQLSTLHAQLHCHSQLLVQVYAMLAGDQDKEAQTLANKTLTLIQQLVTARDMHSATRQASGLHAYTPDELGRPAPPPPLLLPTHVPISTTAAASTASDGAAAASAEGGVGGTSEASTRGAPGGQEPAGRSRGPNRAAAGGITRAPSGGGMTGGGAFGDGDDDGEGQGDQAAGNCSQAPVAVPAFKAAAAARSAALGAAIRSFRPAWWPGPSGEVWSVIDVVPLRKFPDVQAVVHSLPPMPHSALRQLRDLQAVAKDKRKTRRRHGDEPLTLALDWARPALECLQGHLAAALVYSPSPPVPPSYWTTAEDELLLHGINKYGTNWRLIADTLVCSRNATQVANRHKNINARGRVVDPVLLLGSGGGAGGAGGCSATQPVDGSMQGPRDGGRKPKPDGTAAARTKPGGAASTEGPTPPAPAPVNVLPQHPQAAAPPPQPLPLPPQQPQQVLTAPQPAPQQLFHQQLHRPAVQVAPLAHAATILPVMAGAYATTGAIPGASTGVAAAAARSAAPIVSDLATVINAVRAAGLPPALAAMHLLQAQQQQQLRLSQSHARPTPPQVPLALAIQLMSQLQKPGAVAGPAAAAARLLASQLADASTAPAAVAALQRASQLILPVTGAGLESHHSAAALVSVAAQLLQASAKPVAHVTAPALAALQLAPQALAPLAGHVTAGVHVPLHSAVAAAAAAAAVQLQLQQEPLLSRRTEAPLPAAAAAAGLRAVVFPGPLSTAAAAACPWPPTAVPACPMPGDPGGVGAPNGGPSQLLPPDRSHTGAVGVVGLTGTDALEQNDLQGLEPPTWLPPAPASPSPAPLPPVLAPSQQVGPLVSQLADPSSQGVVASAPGPGHLPLSHPQPLAQLAVPGHVTGSAANHIPYILTQRALETGAPMTQLDTDTAAIAAPTDPRLCPERDTAPLPQPDPPQPCSRTLRPVNEPPADQLYLPQGPALEVLRHSDVSPDRPLHLLPLPDLPTCSDTFTLGGLSDLLGAGLKSGAVTPATCVSPQGGVNSILSHGHTMSLLLRSGLGLSGLLHGDGDGGSPTRSAAAGPSRPDAECSGGRRDASAAGGTGGTTAPATAATAALTATAAGFGGIGVAPEEPQSPLPAWRTRPLGLEDVTAPAARAMAAQQPPAMGPRPPLSPVSPFLAGGGLRQRLPCDARLAALRGVVDVTPSSDPKAKRRSRIAAAALGELAGGCALQHDAQPSPFEGTAQNDHSGGRSGPRRAGGAAGSRSRAGAYCPRAALFVDDDDDDDDDDDAEDRGGRGRDSSADAAEGCGRHGLEGRDTLPSRGAAAAAVAAGVDQREADTVDEDMEGLLRARKLRRVGKASVGVDIASIPTQAQAQLAAEGILALPQKLPSHGATGEHELAAVTAAAGSSGSSGKVTGLPRGPGLSPSLPLSSETITAPGRGDGAEEGAAATGQAHAAIPSADPKQSTGSGSSGSGKRRSTAAAHTTAAAGAGHEGTTTVGTTAGGAPKRARQAAPGDADAALAPATAAEDGPAGKSLIGQKRSRTGVGKSSAAEKAGTAAIVARGKGSPRDAAEDVRAHDYTDGPSTAGAADAISPAASRPLLAMPQHKEPAVGSSPGAVGCDAAGGTSAAQVSAARPPRAPLRRMNAGPPRVRRPAATAAPPLSAPGGHEPSLTPAPAAALAALPMPSTVPLVAPMATEGDTSPPGCLPPTGATSSIALSEASGGGLSLHSLLCGADSLGSGLDFVSLLPSISTRSMAAVAGGPISSPPDVPRTAALASMAAMGCGRQAAFGLGVGAATAVAQPNFMSPPRSLVLQVTPYMPSAGTLGSLDIFPLLSNSTDLWASALHGGSACGGGGFGASRGAPARVVAGSTADGAADGGPIPRLGRTLGDDTPGDPWSRFMAACSSASSPVHHHAALDRPPSAFQPYVLGNMASSGKGKPVAASTTDVQAEDVAGGGARMGAASGSGVEGNQAIVGVAGDAAGSGVRSGQLPLAAAWDAAAEGGDLIRKSHAPDAPAVPVDALLGGLGRASRADIMVNGAVCNPAAPVAVDMGVGEQAATARQAARSEEGEGEGGGRGPSELCTTLPAAHVPPQENQTQLQPQTKRHLQQQTDDIGLAAAASGANRVAVPVCATASLAAAAPPPAAAGPAVPAAAAADTQHAALETVRLFGRPVAKPIPLASPNMPLRRRLIPAPANAADVLPPMVPRGQLPPHDPLPPLDISNTLSQSQQDAPVAAVAGPPALAEAPLQTPAHSTAAGGPGALRRGLGTSALVPGGPTGLEFGLLEAAAGEGTSGLNTPQPPVAPTSSGPAMSITAAPLALMTPNVGAASRAFALPSELFGGAALGSASITLTPLPMVRGAGGATEPAIATAAANRTVGRMVGGRACGWDARRYHHTGPSISHWASHDPSGQEATAAGGQPGSARAADAAERDGLLLATDGEFQRHRPREVSATAAGVDTPGHGTCFSQVMRRGPADRELAAPSPSVLQPRPASPGGQADVSWRPPAQPAPQQQGARPCDGFFTPTAAYNGGSGKTCGGGGAPDDSARNEVLVTTRLPSADAVAVAVAQEADADGGAGGGGLREGGMVVGAGASGVGVTRNPATTVGPGWSKEQDQVVMREIFRLGEGPSTWQSISRQLDGAWSVEEVELRGRQLMARMIALM